MEVINPNAGGYKMSVRWNRHFGSLMVDVSQKGDLIKCGHPLRFGDQDITHGIRAKVSGVSPTRYFGDILDARIEFYTGCSSST